MQPGDWSCPNPSCQNHTNLVFGKYDQCPKCGSSKSAAFGDERPNDWQCPTVNCVNHRNMVHGRHHSCPKCGSGKPYVSRQPYHSRASSRQAPRERPQREPEVRADDWQCSNETCINHEKLVFGKYDACPSCGAAKNAEQVGDWQCPNAGCQNHRSNVFASKRNCPRCGTPRPEGRRGPRPPMPGAQGKGAMFGGYGQAPLLPHVGPRAPPGYQMVLMPDYMAQSYLGKGGGAVVHGGGKGGQAGDWKCPNRDCINHTKLVFGRHDSCPKCGEERKDDWKCPNADCINHKNRVFGKHDSCPKCGSAKSDRNRSRSPRG